MRIIFMGSPDFALPALDALVKAGHEVVAVYCQPPRPAGRGKGDRKTGVHERAEQLGLEVRTPKSLRIEEEQAQFAALNAELAVVAAYGLILPKPILDAPKLGCVNIHASLLPRWRGAAPIQRALLAGDPVSGVTIMKMDVGLDTGPILLTKKLLLNRKNSSQVTQEMAEVGAEAILEWIGDPTSYRPRPQPDGGVTYAPKIDKAETRIDWNKPAIEIERQIRAFAPSPGAWFEVNGERIKLLDARAGDDAAGKPGEVLDNCLNIATGGGYLRPLRIQRAGRSAMTVEELLRGFAIPKGTILP